MPRKPFDRSPAFGGRFQGMLERAGVPRQRVARHLERVYGSPDFRAFEGRLMRYSAGLVPKPPELEPIVRAIVQGKPSEVMRWLYEGGSEPSYTVTFDNVVPDDQPVAAAPRAGPPQPRAAEPLPIDPSDPLAEVLRRFGAGRLSLDEARNSIVGLAKAGLLEAARFRLVADGSTGTSSSSCRSTTRPHSSKRGEIIHFPSLQRLAGGVAK